MYRNPSCWEATLLVALVMTGGCGRRQAADATREGRMVYVDTITAEPVVMEITAETPAIQPLTGDRTLMPGLYCPDCETWHPVPPADQINRVAQAGRCPKSGTPLTLDGPWPQEATLVGKDSPP